ncbi:MAG TPA: hypothetical protein VK756_02235 [Solirubrobacteraceae bacterium]|nr:hypothetical protein [Solirubrobacteraceae bacterium]
MTIFPELVPLVRDGLYFDLQGRLEEIDGAIRSRGRQDIRGVVEAGLARAEEARALLDAVGWLDVAGEQAAVVDVCRHRELLLGAIATRMASERSVQGDGEASGEQRAQAFTREGLLVELAGRVREASDASTGVAVVPASLVSLLREGLVSALADCAGEIEEDGREHPGGLDERPLQRFDAYRALLEELGLQSTVPAVGVRLDLSVHRWALVSVLRWRRDCERYLVWSVDAARARRCAARIEEFMSTAGLQEPQDRRGPRARCEPHDESSQQVAWGWE